MTKIEEVFSDKIVRCVQVVVIPNKDVSNKSMLFEDFAVKRHVSKLSMSVTLHENEDEDEENVKNDEEVKDDIYDNDDGVRCRFLLQFS